MSRRIQTISYEGTGGTPADSYFDRIVKYIPADVVAAWAAITAAVKGVGNQIPADTVLWVCFVLLAIFTPYWVLGQATEPGKPKPVTQAAIATVAFVIWVFALGAPFSSLAFYNGLFGTVAIILFTLWSGRIVPKEG